MKGRYPLDALRRLRRANVDARVREVAEERARSESAETEQRRARLTREQADAESERTQRAERERLESGRARAYDLLLEASWQAGDEARREQLRKAEERARASAERQRRAEEAARAWLGQADADAKAVERHREGWQAERNRERELAEEEGADEAFAARRGR